MLTGLAGYLSLETITGFLNPESPSVTVTDTTNTDDVASSRKDMGLGKSLSSSSLNLKKHDIVTNVGISIHLERSASMDFDEEEPSWLQRRSVSVRGELNRIEESPHGSLAEETGSQCSGTE